MRLLILLILLPFITQGQIVRTHPYYKPFAASCSYLLDQYSGAAAAYSLRKLRCAYSGSLIRVRRSSDNTEQDIGATANGDLDTAALKTFIGSGDGFVVTWYDQKGSANLSQTTSINQPSIAGAGVINRLSGLPAVYIDGTNDWMETVSSVNIGTTISIVASAIQSGNTSYRRLLNGYPDIYFFFGSISDNVTTFYGNGTSWGTTSANSATAWTTKRIVTSINNGTDSLYINNTAQTPRSNAMGSFNNKIHFGGVYYSAGAYQTNQIWKGFTHEFIIFNSAISSQREGIVNNLNSYYSIF